MSDSILRYVPTDPLWQPSPADARKAISLLKSIAPEADDVGPIFEDKVTFYDPGQNWLGVECSSCGADAEKWWGDAMDIAYASEFTSLTVEAPCCGTTVSLNNLRYLWPAAFGRFAIEARNPNIADTSEEQDQQIADCLGTTLRKMWVRV
ncbi:hypothetical protein G6L63_23535 [Agrobacterium vitis]|uniref:Uncharacterized protein n=1 Tax=Agrobacterium vitis TaxID=373 RepID=A0A368NZ82_AGRVI|nr:hypothetical protein [Agrobacterium vitis]KAA3505430.1 hypothetical protein DXM22_25085 [Agrobacterium vitis]KAA3519317.1 hypothetical protein DXT89_26145 [Agrobacterium vitis]MCF1480334.1 hypothetical protein [Agrobacterium vitis]MUZ99703.1 hypothetical protein [Agrobacterium vitis]MVA32512.1 hypothetical protein [Agrobacterium vitis]